MFLSLRVTARAVGSDGSGTGDLVAFVVSLLAEGREQDDSLVGSEPVRDPSSSCAEREAQFKQPVAERPRIGHSRREAVGGESFDHDFRPFPLRCRDGVDPFFDLGMKFDSEHGPIIADVRSSHKSDETDRRLPPSVPDPPVKVGYGRS